jgi:hypothetical protein
MNRRQSTRKLLDPLHVSDIMAVDHVLVVAHYGTLINASATGLLIEIQPEDLSPELRWHDIPLSSIEGEHVIMRIIEMELELDGTIVRTERTAQEYVELAIDFTNNAPRYWRECLADLLPSLGEMAEM